MGVEGHDKQAGHMEDGKADNVEAGYLKAESDENLIHVGAGQGWNAALDL